MLPAERTRDTPRVRLSWSSSGALACLFACSGAGCFALDGCLFEGESQAGGAGGLGEGGGGSPATGGGGSGGGGPAGWIRGVVESNDPAFEVRFLDLALGDGELIVGGVASSSLLADIVLGPSCVLSAPFGSTPFVAFFDLEGACISVVADVEANTPVSVDSISVAVARGEEPGVAYAAVNVAAQSRLYRVAGGAIGAEIVQCDQGKCRIRDLAHDGVETLYAVGGFDRQSGEDPCVPEPPPSATERSVLLAITRDTVRGDLCTEVGFAGVMGTGLMAADNFLGRVHALPGRVVFSGTSAGPIGSGENECLGPCVFYGEAVDNFSFMGTTSLQPGPGCASLPVVATDESVWSLETDCVEQDTLQISLPFEVMTTLLDVPADFVVPRAMAIADQQVVGAGEAIFSIEGDPGAEPWGFLALQAITPRTPDPSLSYLIPRSPEKHTGSTITGVTYTDDAVYFVGSFGAESPATVELESFAPEPASPVTLLGPFEIAGCTGGCRRPFIARWELPSGP